MISPTCTYIFPSSLSLFFSSPLPSPSPSPPPLPISLSLSFSSHFLSYTGIVAVSCGDSYSFNERIDLSFVQSSFLILIWSFVDPIHPQLFLEAPDTVRCFQFNPSNPDVVVGGCANGQIVLWNISDYQDRLQLNKAADPLQPRSMAANLVSEYTVLFYSLHGTYMYIKAFLCWV